ncbi:MAG: hypothetical protein LC647_01055, partial [Beggiatoa sp.]|nr:hypothetical protein [Beggiatoa sp.]
MFSIGYHARVARDEIEALVRQRDGDARDEPAIDEEVVGRGREGALVDPILLRGGGEIDLDQVAFACES